MMIGIGVRVVGLQVEKNEDGDYGMFVEVEILGRRVRQQLLDQDGKPFKAESPRGADPVRQASA